MFPKEILREVPLKLVAESTDDRSKIKSAIEGSTCMAEATTGLPLRGLDCVSIASSEKANCRRHMTPEAGRALEILGHAIEYLTDENLRDASQISAHDPHVQAVQILMALNRQIYYACPVQPAITERLCALFRRTSP